MDTIIWVIIVESRVDRYKNRRKLTVVRFIKSIIFLLLIIAFSFLLNRVNETIVELNVLENTDLLIIDIDNKALTLFGKTYYITR
jgi:hypothetical protein